MDQTDSLPTCGFPSDPKQSYPVKSLLEISDSMDAALLQTRAFPSKSPNQIGPWLPDDNWSPRKPRVNRNYRKQVTRLILSKRNSTSFEFSKSSSVYVDDKYEIVNNIESSRDSVDPYFKKRSSTISGPPTKYTNLKCNTVIPGNVPTYHQTPSLPTLITLQSSANKNFHTAFSLGKVDTEMASSDSVPLLLYTKSESIRQTKSAVIKKQESFNERDELSTKRTEFRSKTSSELYHAKDDVNENNDRSKKDASTEHFDDKHCISLGNQTKSKTHDDKNYHNDDTAMANKSEINSLPRIFNKKAFKKASSLVTSTNDINSTLIPTNNTKTNSLYDDRFDMMTSPPENPRILKILSQRKPSPPMCEFHDISLHIRHYRMYHTVRFTGRFSLANKQIQHDIQPVQWSEVFPHRPLSVNPTTTVPVFRLNVQDFSNNSRAINNNNTNHDNDNNNKNNNNDSGTNNNKDGQALALETDKDALSCVSVYSDKSKLEVPKINDKKQTGTEVGDEYKPYRRRSTPNYKDRSVTIDLTQVVTPVLKFKVKKNCVEDEDQEIDIQGEDDLNVGTGSKRHAERYFDTDDAPGKGSKKTKKNKAGNIISSKDDEKFTKRLSNLSKEVRIVGNINMKQEEAKPDCSDNEQVQESHSKTSQSSGNSCEDERNTHKVLFSYREFLKRSASNLSRNSLYVPRLRHSRESILERQKSNDSDWKYPYSRKHAYISILNSDNGAPIPNNSQKVVIDEKQLKSSIEEKIHDSNLHFNLRQRKYDAAGDKFIKFMVHHEDRQGRQDPKISGSMQEEIEVPIDGLGIVSTYDVDTYDSYVDDILEITEKESSSHENAKSSKDSENSPSDASSKNKLWCPKNSRLSARTRKNYQNTESIRQLISSPFQNQALQSAKNSAFVIAVPPPRKGFDDRSVVLPVQDFMHLAMKGNEQTFSSVSNTINNGCKLGISQNMMIQSASNRRPIDDGLVRIVSFASPVNQFIFAKRITGYSAASRGAAMSESDGSFSNMEQKARSVFQGKELGGYRLRLKDFGVRRVKAEHSCEKYQFPNNDKKIVEVEEKDKNKNDTQTNDKNDKFGEENISQTDVEEICSKEEKHIGKSFIPKEDNPDLYETEISKKTDDFPKMQEGNDNGISKNVEPKFRQETHGHDLTSAKERERSELRRHIVKLAEIRSSSQASSYEYATSGIYEVHHPAMSSSYDSVQKTGTRGFKLMHSNSTNYGQKIDIRIPTGQTNDVDDALISGFYTNTADTVSKDSTEFDHPKTCFNENLSHDTQDKLTEQQSRFNLRQRAKSKQRKRILKPDVTIHKDIKVDTSPSMDSHKRFAEVPDLKGIAMPTMETKGPLVPEGNPMMYSRIVRGSCLKKETIEEVEVQRPKTVRFKCDEVEYKIVERNNDNK